MTTSTTNMLTPTTTFFAGVLFSIYQAIPWVAIFLITQLFGVRLYVLKDKTVCQRVQKRLTRSSHVADGGKGYGISVGRWYFASVSITHGDMGDQYDVWMIATAASFERLTLEAPTAEPLPSVEGQTVPPAPPTSITVFERVGTFFNPWFKKRNMQFTSVKPREEQTEIMDKICVYQKAHGHTVVFLHGPPGTGKSMIGVLLADRLHASYCNTLKPWQPGDTLADLYAEAEPTAEKPLVVAFDEFDGAIMAIHVGITPHKSTPTLVPDKAGWNRFLDEIGRGMYPHLILILTSNRDPSFIRAMDPSYIRDGRVDLTIPVLAKIDVAATSLSDGETSDKDS